MKSRAVTYWVLSSSLYLSLSGDGNRRCRCCGWWRLSHQNAADDFGVRTDSHRWPPIAFQECGRARCNTNNAGRAFFFLFFSLRLCVPYSRLRPSRERDFNWKITVHCMDYSRAYGLHRLGRLSRRTNGWSIARRHKETTTATRLDAPSEKERCPRRWRNTLSNFPPVDRSQQPAARRGRHKDSSA